MLHWYALHFNMTVWCQLVHWSMTATHKKYTNMLDLRSCMTKNHTLALYELYKLSDKIKRSFSEINTHCKVSERDIKWMTCISSVNNWRNQWFTCSLLSLLSKSFSRKVTSLAGHIFMVHGKSIPTLGNANKPESWNVEKLETTVISWRPPSHKC